MFKKSRSQTSVALLSAKHAVDEYKRFHLELVLFENAQGADLVRITLMFVCDGEITLMKAFVDTHAGFTTLAMAPNVGDSKYRLRNCTVLSFSGLDCSATALEPRIAFYEASFQFTLLH